MTYLPKQTLQTHKAQWLHIVKGDQSSVYTKVYEGKGPVNASKGNSFIQHSLSQFSIISVTFKFLKKGADGAGEEKHPPEHNLLLIIESFNFPLSGFTGHYDLPDKVPVKTEMSIFF